MRVIVYHGSYGCDTGCCGHVVELEDGQTKFEFAHPGWKEDRLAFAKDLVREAFGDEHVADLDWSQCVISDD